MILVWENTGVFKKHLEEMESFRRTHMHGIPVQQMKKVKATQIPSSTPPCRPGAGNCFKDDRGNSIVVPIWDMSMPKGAQN